MILRCATSNFGKLREFRLAGERYGVEVEALPDLRQIPPPEESGTTFEANAVGKALYYVRHSPDWVFADDSGLEVDALNGAPGVFSARYAGENATDVVNNELLLERLENKSDRTARFVCVVALAYRGKLVKTFRGIVRGEIATEPRGTSGFGYDPIFFYPPFNCTFGEAPLDRKMAVSHRAQALAELFRFFRDLRQSE